MLAAFCSGSETAFSAAGKIQVAARGRKGARALWFMEKPSRYLATTLVGTNVGVVLTASISHGWGVEMGVGDGCCEHCCSAHAGIVEDGRSFGSYFENWCS